MGPAVLSLSVDILSLFGSILEIREKEFSSVGWSRLYNWNHILMSRQLG
jgi:hypothetical protein